MAGRIVSDDHQVDPPADGNRSKQQSIQQAQEVIYNFLIERVKNHPPETVLLDFKQLFFLSSSPASSEALQALYEIIFKKQEEEFANTLKRSCYILINNWSSKRKSQYIHDLVQLFTEVKITHHSVSPSLNRLRTWLANFSNSQDYQELKLFAAPYITQDRGPWSQRYTSYLLVPQYLDSSNPIEQRETARKLSKQLKDKFKFDLAMYAVRCEYPNLKEDNSYNPTKLGDGVIRLIKKVVSKHLLFNYVNHANIFIQQIQDLKYIESKQSLQNYLAFSVHDPKTSELLNTKLFKKLDALYEVHNQQTLMVDLLLRTCRRVIDFLTLEDGREPSSLFILLNTQGSTLALVTILLKIILICKYAHTHLEVCIAKLIRYYENSPEKDCQWFINFLEIFNIVFALYTENVQYNLVKVKEHEPDLKRVVDFDAYRVFSQLKGADLRGTNLSGADIRSTDLSAADLRSANLSSTDLSHADLSLAKLSQTNLSGATLTGANLSTATLNGADLSNATLNGADLRCAQLQQANLSHANLTAAKLRRADLRSAQLNGATLSSASLNAANLIGADLRYADLSKADLSEADLNEANLSEANLTGAALRHTKLQQANLSGANLYQASLYQGNLSGANLIAATLNETNLDHVNLQSADLTGALLRGATLINANLSRANLSRTDLSRADLSQSNLNHADLSDAILRHVNLKEADLSYANLSGANLFNTNLGLANVKGTQFRNNSGLPERLKLELEERGALFD